uniref:Phosphate transporter n=1 Tax=Haptolina ericina TaxID=156174 RepID=A0A7S3F1X3_9EUKA
MANWWAVGLGAPAAFLLAFSNGANDIANSMGTIVGANAMTMRQALISGAVFEFVGAMAIGPFVAGSIAGGQLHTSVFSDDPKLFALLMLSALIGAGGTTLLATLYGYPISATHGVISGIIAVALCTGVPGALDTSGFSHTLFGWVASPVVGMLAGMVVSGAVHQLVIAAPDPVKAAKKRQPLLLTLTAAISFLFLLLKGPPIVTGWVDKRYWLAMGLSLLGGMLVTAARAVWSLLHAQDEVLLNRHEKSCEMTGCATTSTTSTPTSLPEDGCSEKGGSDVTRSDCGSDMGLEEGSSLPKFDGVQQPFVSLLMVAGLTVALAHGANDVGNAVGPLGVLLDPSAVIAAASHHGHPSLPIASLLLGGIAFVVGILCLGSRTISTVGSKITALTPHRSFATQIGAAVAVLGSSVLGLPVSTSHCLVGAVIGVSLAEKLCGVPDVDLDLNVLRKIVIGWVVTIPLAAIVAVCSFFPLRWAFH